MFYVVKKNKFYTFGQHLVIFYLTNTFLIKKMTQFSMTRSSKMLICKNNICL